LSRASLRFLSQPFACSEEVELFFRGGWLDLLGSLPLSRFAIFRVARLIRILRIMRTLRPRDYRTILTRRLAQSTLLFTLVVALLIFVISGIVLDAEKGAPHANILTHGEAV
jgi:voltage-gated potassium channel